MNKILIGLLFLLNGYSIFSFAEDIQYESICNLTGKESAGKQVRVNVVYFWDSYHESFMIDDSCKKTKVTLMIPVDEKKGIDISVKKFVDYLYRPNFVAGRLLIDISGTIEWDSEENYAYLCPQKIWSFKELKIK